MAMPTKRKLLNNLGSYDTTTQDHATAVFSYKTLVFTMILANETSLEKVEPRPGVPIFEEEITDPARLQGLIPALVVLNGSATLRTAGGAANLEFSGFEADCQLLWKFIGTGPWNLVGLATLEVVGHNSVYSFEIPSYTVTSAGLLTAMPSKVMRQRRRGLRRASPSCETLIRFPNPGEPGDYLRERPIRDLAFGGLSFLADIPQDMLYPNQHLPLMTISTEEDELQLHGVVRSMTRQPDGRYICGLTVKPWSREDETQWVRFVAQHLSPTTQTSERMLEALWDLFEVSGYFQLAGKHPEDFTELREAFFRLGQKAPTIPQLICQVVWPSEMGVEGSVSFTKAYSKAWMGHQLAKRTGKPPKTATDPGQILRDVYTRAFEHPQSDPAFEWVVCYVEPKVKWIDRSHLAFAARHHSTEDVYAKRIHLMTARCDEYIEERTTLEIGFATYEEREFLAEDLATRYPRPYLQALDFTPEALAMEAITNQWRYVNLERGRAIIAARSEGQVVAFGIFEAGHLGTNLFRLLDCVRIISITPTEGAHEALLNQARLWYKARQRSEFIYLREDSDTSYISAAKLHEDSEPCLWIIAARHVPEFLEHIQETTMPRIPEKQENRPQIELAER